MPRCPRTPWSTAARNAPRRNDPKPVVGASGSELGCTEPFQRIDQLRVEAVFENLQDLDRRREVLGGRFILLAVVLDDTEVVKRLRGFMRLRAIDLYRHLDHAFCCDIGGVVILLFEQTDEPGVLAQHVFFGQGALRLVSLDFRTFRQRFLFGNGRLVYQPEFSERICLVLRERRGCQ